jgi:hypothetical protein
MKTLRNISLTMFVGLVLASFIPNDNFITIEQALLEKKIELVIPPYETYPQDGILVTVKNISGKRLSLKMSMGSIFIPDSEEEQTLIRSEEEVFALTIGQEKTLQFEGYCTELHDKGCDKGTAFKMDKTKNTKLLNLLTYMDSLGIKNQNTIQHAIWCITDNSPVSYIGSPETPSPEETLRAYLCSITGQKDTWYMAAADIIETPEHEFVIVTKEVTGEITFTSTSEVHLYGVVKDSTGKVLHTSPSVINAPSDVEVSFDFALTVIGWAPGKYSVVYTNNGVVVINQEFEI